MTDNTNSTNYKTDKETTIAVNQIGELIELIYPDPNPNVFTLSDFLNRYKITGLGKRAIEAIEQAQRINRSTSDVVQLGLCEFYIGLIYLYSGDYRGAIEQFKLSLKRWEVGNSDLIVESRALARYAEGVAQQIIYHYEYALIAFSYAEHHLQNSSSWNSSNEKAKEVNKILSGYIKERQNKIRQVLWKAESGVSEPAAVKQKENAEEKKPQIKEQSYTDKERQHPPYVKDTASKTPSNLAVKQYFYTLPESIEYEDYCQWYKVQESNKEYLPQLEKGTLLLIDHRIENHTCRENDLILVGTDNENAIIPVTSFKEHLSSFSRIHITTPRLVGLFTRPQQKSITLHDIREIPDSDDEIIGVVVGFWHYINA